MFRLKDWIGFQGFAQCNVRWQMFIVGLLWQTSGSLWNIVATLNTTIFYHHCQSFSFTTHFPKSFIFFFAIMSDDKKPLHHNLHDASGADETTEDRTATAILRRKKKDNGMFSSFFVRVDSNTNHAFCHSFLLLNSFDC